MAGADWGSAVKTGTVIVVVINMFRFNRDQGFGWIWKTADRLFEAN